MKIVFDSDRGDYTQGQTIHLRPNMSLQDAVSAAAHELGHAWEDAKNVNQGNIRRQSRDDYINTAIKNEVFADSTRYYIYSELADKSSMPKPDGYDDWAKLNTSEERDKLITDRYVGPNAVLTDSRTGQPYSDYYGGKWDAAHNKKPGG